MLMAHSVEGRFPFLDRNVAALADSLPAAYKLRVLDEKHVLKRAAREAGPAGDPRAGRSSRIAPRTRCRSPAQRPPAGSTRWPAPAPWPMPASSRPPPPRQVIAKCRARAASGQFSNTDNMAVVGLLSTQLVYDGFIRRRPEGGPPIPLRTDVSFARGDAPVLSPR